MSSEKLADAALAAIGKMREQREAVAQLGPERQEIEQGAAATAARANAANSVPMLRAEVALLAQQIGQLAAQLEALAKAGGA